MFDVLTESAMAAAQRIAELRKTQGGNAQNVDSGPSPRPANDEVGREPLGEQDQN